jgi:hypothetical protein
MPKMQEQFLTSMDGPNAENAGAIFGMSMDGPNAENAGEIFSIT